MTELLDRAGYDLDRALWRRSRSTASRLDSRKVKPGDLFVAVPGTKADGLSFAPQAIAAGAVAVMASGALDAVAA